MRSFRLTTALGLWLFLSLLPAQLRADELARGVEDLASARLEPAEARFVANVKVAAGPASFRLERGFLFPARTDTGAATGEFVFVGRGSFECRPPNDLEADQLEVFTEQRTLEVDFSTALFAIGSEAVRQSLLDRPVVSAEAADLERARKRFGEWRGSRAREILGIDASLVRAARGEPDFGEFFAATVTTLDLGDVQFLVDPDAREQVSLGRFVPLELEAREERKLRRALHREQRRGRLIGAEIEDLGSWDHWNSSSLPSGPGRSRYEARHYQLNVATEGWGPLIQPQLRVTARLELVAGETPSKMVLLRLPKLATVAAVRNGATGTALPFERLESEMLVALAESPPPGGTVSLEVDYSGPFFERAEGKGVPRWYLPDSTGWYPQVGEQGRATFDVTVAAPKDLEVVAPGSQEGRRNHFVLSRPTFGFTFEIGRFKRTESTSGPVPITVFVDDHAALGGVNASEILDYTRRAVEYLIGAFGPLPVDSLTVVSTPRTYSQSFLGHLVLAEDMMSFRRRIEDSRTVIAHEVAHQWWGHHADFASYRDQWLTEALANYSAVLYARERLDRWSWSTEVGPLFGWNVILPLPIENGRTLESLGPVVLGGRLDSSLAPAYVPIVYWKGALLVDMLDNVFGQGQFLDNLRKLLAEHADNPLTTESFLEGLAEHGGVNLDEFARRFVYGVGLPEVYFSYDFRRISEGKWEVVGRARQEAPYRYRYRLVPGEGGGLPRVLRYAEAQSSVSIGTWLPVPVEIGVFDPSLPRPKPKEKAPHAYRVVAPGTFEGANKKAVQAKLEREGNSIIRGRTLLRGAETAFRFETELEPRALWFDRRGEVFSRFFDERVEPKRMALYRAIDHAAAEHFSEAEAELRAALAASVTHAVLPETRWVKRFLEAEGEALDRSIRLTLARVHLAQGRIADATIAWQEAQAADRVDASPAQWAETRLLAAHLALARGRASEVHRILGKNGRKNPELGSREADALRAIAYWAEGNRGALATVRRKAEADGLDLSLLDAQSPTVESEPETP